MKRVLTLAGLMLLASASAAFAASPDALAAALAACCDMGCCG